MAKNNAQNQPDSDAGTPESTLSTMTGMDWWNRWDPEQKEPTWGRCCLRCRRAVPTGSGYAHSCGGPGKGASEESQAG